MKACVLKGDAQPEYFFREGCWIAEWANSAADEDASVARVRVEPGKTTRPHRLEGTTERYVILEGKAKVRVEGLPETEVGPGDVVLIPPGATQSLTNPGEHDLLFLAVCTPRFREESYRPVC